MYRLLRQGDAAVGRWRFALVLVTLVLLSSVAAIPVAGAVAMDDDSATVTQQHSLPPSNAEFESVSSSDASNGVTRALSNGPTADLANVSGEGIVFVAENGNLSAIGVNGNVIDYGVTDVEVIGPRLDFDGDGEREAPYSDSDGNLFIVDDSGTTEQLVDAGNFSYGDSDITVSTGGNNGRGQMGVGDWDSDGNPDILFPASAQVDTESWKGNIFRIDADDGPTPIKANTNSKAEVIFSTDITGDNVREIVFENGNSDLLYFNSTNRNTPADPLSGDPFWGSDSNIGLAEPADLTNSGGTNPEPSDYDFGAIGGSQWPQWISLTDILAGNTNVTQHDSDTYNATKGKKTSPTSTDWTGDGTSDFLYLDNDCNDGNCVVRYYDVVNDELGTVTNENNETIHADNINGLAGRISMFEDRLELTTSGQFAGRPQLSGATAVNNTTLEATITSPNDVDEATISQGDFSVDPGSISNIETSETGRDNNDTVVTITLDSRVDADAVDVTVSEGSIDDGTGNSVTGGTKTATGMDGVAPTLNDATTVNTSAVNVTIADGNDVAEDTIEAGDFSLSPGSVANVSVTESDSDAVVTIRLDPVNADSVEISIDGSIDDESGNSLTSGSNTVTGMEGVAPSFATDYPATSSPTAGGFDIDVQADENGTAHYVVIADGSEQPTAQQIRNGENSTGNAALANGQGSITAGESTTLTATGLDSETSYDAYVIAEDGNGNAAASGTLEATTDTADSAAPSFTDAVGVDETTINATIADNLNIDENTIESGDFSVAPGSISGIDVTENGTNATVTITLDSAVDADSVEVSIVGSIDDTADNSLSEESKTVSGMDAVAPDISVVTTADDTDGNGVVSDGDTVEATATVTDGGGVSSVTADASAFDAGSVALADDGSNSTASDNQYSATFTVGSSPAEGDQSVVASATDDADNGGSQAVESSGTLTVDTTAPEIASGSFDATNPESRNVTVAFESDESLSSISVEISGSESATLDESDFTETSTEGDYEYTATYEGSSDGTYDATLNAAEDDAGNDGAGSQSDDVRIDTTPSSPVADGVSLTESDGEIALTLDTDEQVGPDASDLQISVDGPSTTDAYTFDRTGFSESENGDGTYTYTLKTGEAPAYDDGSGVYAATLDTVIDTADNEGGAPYESGDGSDTYDYDGTPPDIGPGDVTLENTSDQSVGITVTSNEQLSALTVELSDSDNAVVETFSLSDFDEYEQSSYHYALSSTFDTDADDTYTATLTKATDGASNDGAHGQSDDATVDTTAPTLDDATRVDDTTIDVTVSDGGSGIDESSIDGADFSAAPGTIASIDTSGVTDGATGPQTVQLTLGSAVDSDSVSVSLRDDGIDDTAGNSRTSGSVEATGMDGVPPSVSAFAVSTPSGQTVEISFDADEQLSDIEANIGGTESATLIREDFTETGDGPYTYTATYDGSSDGTYDAALNVAEDAASNDGAGGESDSVTVDTTLPTVADGSFAVTNPESQDVRVSFETDEQLSAVTVDVTGPETATLDESDFTETPIEGGYTYEATYQGSSDGEYTATLSTAEDAAGNDGAGSESDSATVDTQVDFSLADDVTAGPITGANESDYSVDVTLPDDNEAGSLNVTLSDGSASVEQTVDVSAGAGETTVDGIDASGLSEGSVNVVATFTDAYGNEDQTETSITKDTTIDFELSATDMDLGPIAASNESDYSVDVTLPDDNEAGSLNVTLSDGTTSVEKTVDVSAIHGTTTVSGIDASSLSDGSIDVTTTFTDEYDNGERTETTVQKDTTVGVDLSADDVAAGPVTGANETDYAVDVTLPGDTEVGELNVTLTDGTTAVEQTVEVSAGQGETTVSGIDASSLSDGQVDAIATFSDAYENDEQAETSVRKDTAVEFGLSTDNVTTGPITTNNESDYAVDVALPNDNEAGTLNVTLTDGTTAVERTADVTADQGETTVSNIDATGLADGSVDVIATFTDEYDNVESVETSVTKDTQVGFALSGDEVDAGSITANNESDYAVDVALAADNEGGSLNVTLSDGSTAVETNTEVSSNQGETTVSGIDASSLSEGSIDVVATFTDEYDNEESTGTSVRKDTAAGFTLDEDDVQVGPITDDNESSYDVDVSLPDSHDAGSVTVTLDDGETTAEATVDVSTDEGPTTVSGIDASELGNGVEATVTFADNYGNEERASTPVPEIDPAVASAAVTDEAPSQLRVTFDANVTATDASGFALDSPADLTVDSLVGVESDDTVVLSLNRSVLSNDSITVSYDAPAGTVASAADGSDATEFDGAAVINNVTPVAPEHNRTVVDDPADELRVTFTGAVAVTDPDTAVDAITVAVDGSEIAVTNVFEDATDADAVVVTVAENVTAGDEINVTYDGGGNIVSPVDGSAAEPFSVNSSVNNSVQNNIESLVATAEASSYHVSVGTTVELRANDSNAPAHATFTWETESRTIADDAIVTTTTLTEPGTRNVTLEASTASETATDTVSITVTDGTAPTVQLSEPPSNITVGEDVTLDASSSTDNVGIAEYEWTFANGTTRTGPDLTAPTVSYDEPGEYTESVTATDASGNANDNSTTVVVEGAEATVSTGSLAFGEVSTNSTGAASVTIGNDGTTALNVSEASIQGRNASEFNRPGPANDGTFVVRPGENRTIPVEFAPVTPSNATATLVLETNSTDAATQRIGLHGAGVEGDLALVEPTVTFDGVTVGGSATATVEFENVGTAPVHVSDMAVATADDGEFAVDSPVPETIAPDETTSVTVTFAPTAVGNATGTLQATTDRGPASVSLVGEGTGPVVDLPNDPISFITIGAGDRVRTEVPVRNHGNEPLQVADATVTGPDADAFRIADAPDTVAPGSTEIVDLRFEPATAGEPEASLQIDSDNPQQPSASVPVNGTAVAANIGIDRRTVNFGNTTVGNTVLLNVTVTNRNSSKANLTVDSTNIVGTNPDDFAVERGGAPFTLAPGESRDIEINFTALQEGKREAQMQIRSDAGNTPLVNVWLSNTRSYIVIQGADDNTVAVDGNNLAAGDRHQVNVSTPTGPGENMTVERLNMTMDRDGDFETLVSHSDDSFDAAYDTDDRGEVLEYVELNHTQGAPDRTFNDTSLQFQVGDDAIPEGTTPQNISLYRYDGGWNTMDVTYLSTSGDVHLYESDTPGFSQFAVTVPTDSEDSTDTDDPTDGDDSTDSNAPTDGEDSTTTDDPTGNEEPTVADDPTATEDLTNTEEPTATEDPTDSDDPTDDEESADRGSTATPGAGSSDFPTLPAAVVLLALFGVAGGTLWYLRADRVAFVSDDGD